MQISLTTLFAVLGMNNSVMVIWNCRSCYGLYCMVKNNDHHFLHFFACMSFALLQSSCNNIGNYFRSIGKTFFHWNAFPQSERRKVFWGLRYRRKQRAIVFDAGKDAQLERYTALIDSFSEQSLTRSSHYFSHFLNLPLIYDLKLLYDNS